MTTPAPAPRSLPAIERVLASLEALRNGRALCVLLGSFAATGLLMAGAESALARDATAWGLLQALGAFAAAFYGSNATGLLLMDQALGREPREPRDAIADALRSAHRLGAVLLLALTAALLLTALFAGLLWLARPELLGARLGAWWFGAVWSVAVVVMGATVLVLGTVVAPLSAPAVWSGLSTRATLQLVLRQLRQRPLFVVMLSAAVALLAGAVGGLVAGVVVGGGRIASLGAVLVTGVDLPPQQLMAGLYGYGLRSLGAAGANVARSPYGVMALIGGGSVFAVALVLPALVYLRGLCAVLLSVQAVESRPARQAAATPAPAAPATAAAAGPAPLESPDPL